MTQLVWLISGTTVHLVEYYIIQSRGIEPDINNHITLLLFGHICNKQKTVITFLLLKQLIITLDDRIIKYKSKEKGVSLIDGQKISIWHVFESLFYCPKLNSIWIR